MKAAKLTIITVSIECPHCEEDQVDPIYGSYHWEIDNITLGQVVTCEDCGKNFKLPKRIIGSIKVKASREME